MIQFPRTSQSRPLRSAERPQRMGYAIPAPGVQREAEGDRSRRGGRRRLGRLDGRRRLVQHGIKVTVYEARKEVGGRA